MAGCLLFTAACTGGADHNGGLGPDGSGTVKGLGGRITLVFPRHGATPDSVVGFQANPPAPRLDLPFARPFGKPVLVYARTGSLRTARVTVSYDPRTIPPGYSTDSVAIAIRGERTDTWEYLPSHVNTRSHTVSAVMPHFSVVTTVVSAPFQIAKAFGDAILGVGDDLLRSAVGVPPKFTCGLTDLNLSIQVNGFARGCVEHNRDDVFDPVVQVQNRFAFPLILKSPVGVTLQSVPKDIGLGDMLKYLYWMTRRETVVAGLETNPLLVNANAPGNFEITAKPDWGPVVIDLLAAIVAIALPQSDALFAKASVALREAESAAGTTIADQAVRDAALSKAAAYESAGKVAAQFEDLGPILDLFDCGLESRGDLAALWPPRLGLSYVGKLTKALSGLIARCTDKFIGTALQHVDNLKSIAKGLASSLKVIPEVVHTLLRAAGYGPSPSDVSFLLQRTSPHDRLGEVLPGKGGPFLAAAKSVFADPQRVEPKDDFGPCLAGLTPAADGKNILGSMFSDNLTMSHKRSITVVLWRMRPGTNIPIARALNRLAAGPVIPVENGNQCMNADAVAHRVDQSPGGSPSVWFSYTGIGSNEPSLIQSYAISGEYFITAFAISGSGEKALQDGLPTVYGQVNALLGTQFK